MMSAVRNRRYDDAREAQAVSIFLTNRFLEQRAVGVSMRLPFPAELACLESDNVVGPSEYLAIGPSLPAPPWRGARQVTIIERSPSAARDSSSPASARRPAP
jgi:hypothetical protein